MTIINAIFSQYSLYDYFLAIAFISFLGFVLENIWRFFTAGIIDNRNMNLPFLFGYGLAILGFFFVLGTPDNIFHGLLLSGNSLFFKHCVYYVLTFFIVSVGEIVLGMSVHKFCGFDYWNYDWIPMHVTSYTSVPTSMGFSVIIFSFMRFVFVPFMDLVKMFSTDFTKYVSCILMILMIVDFVYSFWQMHKNGCLFTKWELVFVNQGQRSLHPKMIRNEKYSLNRKVHFHW